MRLLLTVLIASSLSGCASIAITLAGLGAGAGTNHWMTSVNYHTFAEPLPTVQQAVLTSLVRMEIDLQSSERTDQGLMIKARTATRDIEIDLEALTEKSTHMKITAHEDGSLLLDGATAAEISAQTEKALATPPAKTAAAPAAAAPSPKRATQASSSPRAMGATTSAARGGTGVGTASTIAGETGSAIAGTAGIVADR